MTSQDSWSDHLESLALHDVPAQDRNNLASAIATRAPVGLIDANNRKTGETSLEAAVGADASFYVRARSGKLALDFDSASAVAEAHLAFARLLVAGHAPVLVGSGGPARRHLFCALATTSAVPLLGEIGLRPDDGRVRRTIRPPLARHRSGTARSTLLVPNEVAPALARLKGQAPVRPLGEAGRTVLRRSSLEGSSASVSDTTFRLAMSAANAGWTVEDFITVITCPAVPFSAILQARIDREGWSRTLHWLQQEVWVRAVEVVTTTPPMARRGTGPDTLSAAAWVLDQAWPGRNGATDFSVLMSLLSKRARSGQIRFDMSEREVCLACGMARDAVHKSLSRLQERGLLTKVYQPTGRAAVRVAATWRISISHSGAVMSPQTFELITSALDAEVFRNNSALGKNALRIYVQLVARGMLTTRDLAALTGLSLPRVGELLEEMAELAMVEVVGDEWTATPENLDNVAAELGVAGLLDRQSDRYDRERDARDILQARAPSRTRSPL